MYFDNLNVLHLYDFFDSFDPNMDWETFPVSSQNMSETFLPKTVLCQHFELYEWGSQPLSALIKVPLERFQVI